MQLTFQPLLPQISLQNISSCTIAQKVVKPYVWFGTPTTVNLVQLNVVGQRAPTVYVGMKDPRGFTRLVMSLKNRNSNTGGPGAVANMVV